MNEKIIQHISKNISVDGNLSLDSDDILLNVDIKDGNVSAQVEKLETFSPFKALRELYTFRKRLRTLPNYLRLLNLNGILTWKEKELITFYPDSRRSKLGTKFHWVALTTFVFSTS